MKHDYQVGFTLTSGKDRKETMPWVSVNLLMNYMEQFKSVFQSLRSYVFTEDDEMLLGISKVVPSSYVTSESVISFHILTQVR